MPSEDLGYFEERLSEICDFFNLGSLIKIHKVIECANLNFFVQTKTGEYVIKIIREPHTTNDKASEATYIQYVTHFGIPAPPYLKNKSGEILFKCGDTLIMVQRTFPGKEPAINTKTVSWVGYILGKLSSFPYEHLPQRYGWLNPEYAEENVSTLKEMHDPTANEIIAAYESCKVFEEKILPDLPQSIIHGDPHSGNMLFLHDAPCGVLDWEDSTINASLMDYASAVIYWCLKENGELDRKMYTAFRNAYLENRPLIGTEIYYFEECARYVGVLQTMWRFLNYPEEEREDALWTLNLNVSIPF